MTQSYSAATSFSNCCHDTHVNGNVQCQSIKYESDKRNVYSSHFTATSTFQFFPSCFILKVYVA